MPQNYDFAGWATVNDVKCSDGRVIKQNAFIDQDGEIVPLVYNHNHNDIGDVVGHALLQNKTDGVYTYGTFNDTPKGKVAKELVKHGDITALSIYANNLKQNDRLEVLHGKIRELSLVLAGANPYAYIDTVVAHSEDHDEEARIFLGYIEDEENLEHAENEETDMSDEEKKPETDSKKTVKDVVDTLTDEQKKVVYALLAAAIKDSKKDEKDEEEKEDMKHNVFDNEENREDTVLSHAEEQAIFADAKRYGSLKDSFLAHAETYGINDIDWLFPEARNLNDTPGFIKRNPDEWVSIVMNGVHHTPFSRIKMMFADITADEARAKGYVKGNLKKEEVFGLLKRTVDPTTIYKKQKLDRDDIVDITDFNVVSWLKGEMRMMLDEEIARAILFGDGRSNLSPDHIDATKIIPASADAALYTITCNIASGDTPETIIDKVVMAQDTYEGSGNLIAFLPTETVTQMLLIKDHLGHRMYKTIAELALAMNVNRIVKVPAAIVPTGIRGLVVDLKDYNVGADKGGSVNMFEDFDIDYNQEKYLIETRCSGALVRPNSAIVLKDEE